MNATVDNPPRLHRITAGPLPAPTIARTLTAAGEYALRYDVVLLAASIFLLGRALDVRPGGTPA